MSAHLLEERGGDARITLRYILDKQVVVIVGHG